MDCPLCHSSQVRPFAQVHARHYLECDACRLIFVATVDRLDRAQERTRYESHQNHPADPAYRAFLHRLAGPLVERLAPGAEGLDYGCGPGPTLSRMLQEQGFQVEIYDPFFAPDPAPLQRSYDFITCTETAEHFHRPAQEFEKLIRLLRPGGWLALMTEVLRDSQAFQDWHYARDPTHVCFYRAETLAWIAAHLCCPVERPHPNVALFRKGT